MMADSHHIQMRAWVGHFPKRKAGYSALGFTLVEVIIVVLLVAALATAGVPQILGALNGMKLTAAAEEVVTALRYAQSLSLKEGTAYGVEFDTTLNSFRCYKSSTGETILNPFDKKPYEIELDSGGHIKEVTIETVQFRLLRQYVEFDSLGETVSWTTDPAKAGDVVLQCANVSKTITVSAPLGRITVQ